MPTGQLNPIILRSERLKLLKELGLLSSNDDDLYNRFTEIASKGVDVPVSLVSMVASDRQVFKSQVGLNETLTETPLSHSFCQHVVASNQPLIVTDARESDLLKDNLAIRDLDVIGYLGIPITVLDGQTLGSFCVIDNQPHDWSFVEIALMQELTQILVRELDLRAKARIEPDTYSTRLAATQRSLHRLFDKLDVNQPKEDILTQLRDLREQIVV